MYVDDTVYDITLAQKRLMFGKRVCLREMAFAKELRSVNVRYFLKP